MPTYEYECQLCKHNWEEEKSIKEEPTKTCPKCKKESAKRLISLSRFILAGAGWSKDGYTKK